MIDTTERILSKVPEVTLIFWIIKIAATTLGETGGDTVSMSMNLGYLIGTGIFAAIFLVAVGCPDQGKGLSPIPLLDDHHRNDNSRYDLGGLC